MTGWPLHPAVWITIPASLLVLASAVTLRRIFRTGKARELRPADAIVVFGAAVRDDGPSISLRARLDAAADVYRQGWAPVVLCSGGRARGISEAAVMRNHLVAAGLPAEAVIPDDSGQSSRGTLISAALFGGGAWKRILLVTSPYHMYRVCREAERHALEPLSCPSAAPDPARRGVRSFLVRQYARELAAVTWYALSASLARMIRLPLLRPVTAAWRHAIWRVRALFFETDAVADSMEFLGRRIKAATPDIPDTQTITTPAGGLLKPLRGKAGSRFGMRYRRLHSGIDLRAPYGSPVTAAAAGTVILGDDVGPYGNTVVVDHHGGLATVYAHLTGITMSEGTSVRAGDVIGYVGTTGRSSGPHLHFEVRVHGSPVDPEVYLEDPRSPGRSQ